jgi:5-methylthioadenosine/S-adenosylhomocysteine deaminase
VYREAFGAAPEDADRALAELERKVEEMRARETELVRVGVSPHAPYTVSLALFAKVAGLAAAQSLPVAVHTSESRAEYELVTRSEGPFAERLRDRGIQPPTGASTTIDLLERLALLGPRTLLIHCVQVDASDIARIAGAGASIAHCPIANARLGHGIAPVAEMLEAGITVALGTDSVASSNRLDLLEEGRAAQAMQRARLGSPEALPADRLLWMATLDGARALGLAERVGSLEPGKDADLTAVSLDGIHTRPVHDPLATLFFAARGVDVTLTAVRGRVLYRNGEHRTLEPDALRRRVDALAARLAEARDIP